MVTLAVTLAIHDLFMRDLLILGLGLALHHLAIGVRRLAHEWDGGGQ